MKEGVDRLLRFLLMMSPKTATALVTYLVTYPPIILLTDEKFLCGYFVIVRTSMCDYIIICDPA